MQPGVGWEAVVEEDRRVEEVDDVLVRYVFGPVAGDVEGAEAGRVLAELVGPELCVGGPLVDPVFVHPGEQVVAPKVHDEFVHAWTRVGRDGRPVRQAGRRVGRGHRVVLARQVAVLRVGAVAEVGPEAVQGPLGGREELAVGFAAGVGGPELRGEDEPAVGFGAASVDVLGCGGARAGEGGGVCGRKSRKLGTDGLETADGAGGEEEKRKTEWKAHLPMTQVWLLGPVLG